MATIPKPGYRSRKPGEIPRSKATESASGFDDGEFGVDFDDCFDADGNLRPERKLQLDSLDSYTERSPSGQGLHVIGRGMKQGPKCRRGGVEIYDQSTNYLTFTGLHLEGTPRTVKARQQSLDHLYATALEEIPTGGGGVAAATPSVDLTDEGLDREGPEVRSRVRSAVRRRQRRP